MGKFSILLWDSDPIYVQRLASGLQRLWKDGVVVITATSREMILQMEEHDVNLLLSSRLPEAEWRNKHKECVLVQLDDGEESGTQLLWTQRVYKYQSVSQIAKLLKKYLPSKRAVHGTLATEQNWYGVVSPARHESTVPYGISFAQHLNGQTLIVLLMEFSGISDLLELDETCDAETFLLKLRQSDADKVEEVPFPEVQRVGECDLLNITDNPMVLYELQERDIERLIHRIQCANQHRNVVWVAGNMVQGIAALFQISQKVCVIEKNDTCSICSQREFYRFLQRLGSSKEVIYSTQLPVVSSAKEGAHLVLEWKISEIGEAAERCLRGESIDGTTDRNNEKPDFEPDGCEY